MATSKIKFSPSINIVRDSNYGFNYIPTKNAALAFNSILSDAVLSIKSHVLIGAYGTGKSSFLLALKQTLEGSTIHFPGYQKLLKTSPSYEFMNIVGEFSSFEGYFAKYFKLGKAYTTIDVIKAIDIYYNANKKNGKGLAILVDEFGKFLEYAAKHNPESELYFIQQLAEWANDSKNDTLLICTLHQDFSAYAHSLNNIQRQEWDKVKGRIKDIPFNEPVEQLLYLASERISQKFGRETLDKNFDKLFTVIENAKAFPLRDYFQKDFAKRLYPFDILSASILTLSLQKYGQNERSLFSFLESNDHLGLNEFDFKEFGYYNVARVYDYLLNGYYSFLTTKYNPNFTQWSAIRRSLERIEGLFDDSSLQKDADDIVKVIGLLNIFATGTAKLEPRFYINYAKLSLRVKQPELIIEKLEKHKIIRYVNHNFRYILFEGTDLDIELAIDDAGRLVEKITSVVNYINQYFEFPFISAKAIYYKTGTPRFFQFKLTDEPLKLLPEGEVDGFINLIFSEDSKIVKRIEECSSQCKEAILYGYYKNTAEIKNLLFEIQKVNKVKESNVEDKVALRELDSILSHYINLLNHYVLDNLYTNSGNIIWYFKGAKIKVKDRRQFNQQLSSICEDVYESTPILKNELLNKTKISGQVAQARKKLVEKILSDLDEPNLGFSSTEFPPEKSIYLTLLRETGIHSIQEGYGVLREPTDKSFHELWNEGIVFLTSTKQKERNLQEFVHILSARPFKLKQGFIDFWVPIFLLAKSDEFAIYQDGVYLPEMSLDILDLINKRPHLFTIKAFDVIGIKLELFNRYRVFLNQAENFKPTNKLFIHTIKPFLAFYRDLNDYSKRTSRLDRKTIALRKVIAEAKDPEKAFFDDFPTALGYSLQDLQHKPKAAEQFVKQLQDSIRTLRTSYDGLIDRVESYFIRDVLGYKDNFPDYRIKIKRRYAKIKLHLLQPHQKTFLNRVQSELDDRKAWVGSVAQGCSGKALEKFSDEDEILLYERLKDIIYELDNLSEISNDQAAESEEEILKLEITSLVKGLNKGLIRISNSKSGQVQDKMQELRSKLGADKKLNIFALTKLLQEILQDE